MKPKIRYKLERIGYLGVLFLFICGAAHAARAKSPHYTFILPDKYVGWIQIVFNDPEAIPLALKDDGYVITVPETGISRTSHIRVHDFRRKDEFYYVSLSPSGTMERVPVPPEFVIPGDSHGGFGVMDTGGKGPGYSWFIFIGPPDLRARVPLADWEKVVEEYRKTHGGKANVRVPNPFPTPGRILLASPARQ